MSSSFVDLLRRWSEEDESDEDLRRRSYSGRSNNSSFESIELMITQMFGSCSSNIQSLFGTTLSSPRSRRSRSNGPYTNRTASASTKSESTATTEESSTHSKSKSRRKNMIRSRSLDCRTTPRNREKNLRRHRSMSKGYRERTSIVPNRDIEYTEIAVTHFDDDVSAISARTLNEMYDDEMRKLAIANAKNKKNAIHQSTFEVEKENISDESSHISQKSSGTTEFESIWRTKSNGSPTNRNNADNCRAIVRRDLKNGSICRQGRLWELKRSTFATINENDSLYVDEEEI